MSENVLSFKADASDNKARYTCEAKNIMISNTLKAEIDLTVLLRIGGLHTPLIMEWLVDGWRTQNYEIAAVTIPKIKLKTTPTPNEAARWIYALKICTVVECNVGADAVLGYQDSSIHRWKILCKLR
ncbi:jg8288 [Pararge aegeria aegeria]|uniref:Jg8288 protein n=1 Tax=Pararge aegeria aegeria TaxID=348720 RepID=A0A8S4R7U6_9NEOP|nr:jg8288 [Pararge aegeria aegeria]